jgi:hypothetical protein
MDIFGLYQRRQRADLMRQPKYVDHLHQLDAELKRLDKPHGHPYSLLPSDYARIRESDAYNAVCDGLDADFDAPYCYRLTSWKRIVNHTHHFTSRLIPETSDESEAFDFIKELHDKAREKGRDWLNLSDFIRGVLGGPRDMVWWTPTLISETRTMCDAHGMGLLNNDVGTEVLLLRCEAGALQKVKPKVPSVVDAYFFNIFYPMRLDDAPKVGRCISVEIPKQLSLGAEEVVAAPIDIESSGIQIRPIDLRNTQVHQVYMEHVFPSLFRFYETLT